VCVTRRFCSQKEALEGSGVPISIHNSKHGDQDLRCELHVLDGSFAPADTTQDAIDALNTLQTSFRVLDERRKAGIRLDENVNAEMRAWLKRIGHSVSLLGPD
jgi:hypothetical protein